MTDGGMSGGATYRGDIDGFRAIAVGLVVLFHADVSRFSGGYVGVDAFFVLSGFLITGLLLRELQARGSISLRSFYARRARRLLPLAMLVIISTLIATRLVLAPIDFKPVGFDGIASTLYSANWRFASTLTNYLHADATPSPFLHFWSLAVEEQFYIAWPLLLLGAAGSRGVITKMFPKLGIRTRVAIPLLTITVTSIVWSIASSRSGGPVAYYGLQTRAWELAAGGILALGAPTVRKMPSSVANLIGALGIVGLIFSAMKFDRSTVFPGIAAIVPVGATLLVVAAGIERTPSRWSVARMLANAPLRYIGRISYAWYLWHWPCIIVIKTYAAGDWQDPVSDGWIALAIGISFVLAGFSHASVENPVRFSTRLASAPKRSFIAATIATAVSVAIGFTVAHAAPAQVLAVNDIENHNPLQHNHPCNRTHDNASLATCIWGDQNAPTTLAFFGDSHATHWLAALDRVGKARHIRILQLTMEGCIFADVEVEHAFYPGVPFTQCAEWRKRALAYLHQHPVDTLLIIRSSRTIDRIHVNGKTATPGAAMAEYARGLTSSFAAIDSPRTKVIVLADTPFAPADPAVCITRNFDDISACTFPRAAAIHRDKPLLQAETQFPRVFFADMTNSICPRSPCRTRTPDGTLMWWGSNHLTDAFSQSLATQLGDALDHAIPTPPK